MRIVRGAAAARTDLLRRPPPDAAEVPQSVLDRLRALFGEPMTPEQAVARIIRDVRERGDVAIRDYTQRIDGIALDALEVPRREIEAAYKRVELPVVKAMHLAAARVRAFHQRGLPKGWMDMDAGLGEMGRPLERIGAYIPGGTAAYPSTVLMTVVPAKVAGVPDVVLTTPARKGGEVPPVVLVAADIAGVDRVYRAGGAQAIAALAYGTESVPRVDKIFGPGNLFVMLAKRQVFGAVGIDALQGPTETLIVADDTADPAICAADMLAQAEHDVLAAPLLITTSASLAEQVRRELDRQMETLERKEIVAGALSNRGGIAVVDTLAEAVELANEYGPEHLCLLVRDPWAWVDRIRNAGGVFVGEGSPEVFGDYVAGPSHVMPTSGTARFSGPVNIRDFFKVTSVVALRGDVLTDLAEAASVIARAEGLTAHARAAELRLGRPPAARKVPAPMPIRKRNSRPEQG